MVFVDRSDSSAEFAIIMMTLSCMLLVVELGVEFFDGLALFNLIVQIHVRLCISKLLPSLLESGLVFGSA